MIFNRVCVDVSPILLLCGSANHAAGFFFNCFVTRVFISHEVRCPVSMIFNCASRSCIRQFQRESFMNFIMRAPLRYVLACGARISFLSCWTARLKSCPDTCLVRLTWHRTALRAAASGACARRHLFFQQSGHCPVSHLIRSPKLPRMCLRLRV